MFSLYYNHWEYWQLYQKVTFDGINKLILINNGETIVDVQADIYSAWKQWMLLKSIENFRYLNPFSVIGGEPLTAGQFLDSTYFLINGWRIKPYAGSYTLNIIGNLFEVDGGEIKVDADIVEGNPNNITINTQTSTIVRRLSPDTANTVVTASLVGDQATQLTTIENTSTNTYNEVISQSSTLNTIDSTTSASYTQLLSQSADLSVISGSSAATYDAVINNSSSLADIDVIVTELQSKLDELWQVHGLKIGFPVDVTYDRREVLGSNISQSFTTIGTGSLQQTTVTRL